MAQRTAPAVTPVFVLITTARLVIVMLGTALWACSLRGGDGPHDDAGLRNS
jgi:hypothetical protein